MQKTQTYFGNKWRTGNVRVFGAEEKSSWLGMSVFDGARSFENVQPDLDLHCQRSLRSAAVLGLETDIKWEEIFDLVRDGIKRKFKSDMDLYIRISFWDTSELRQFSTVPGFSITISEYPLTRPNFTANMSKFVRPGPDQAPTDAKASCLYPNSLLALAAAQKEGFDNCITLDPYGNVAEFTMSNVFLVRGSDIYTPVPNRTFLNGITRQRTIDLLRKDGFNVVERTIEPMELIAADEMFSTGNAQKIQSVSQFENHMFGDFSVAERAWELYRDFAHS